MLNCRKGIKKKVKTKNEEKTCGLYSFLAEINSSRGNSFRVSNYGKSLHETKTIGIDLTFGLLVDDIEKLIELSNLKNL